MSVWIKEDAKVIVQGITGRQGQFHSMKMAEYGTDIVGGCTPGKGGQMVDLGVKAEIIEKSGSWFSYKNNKIGQGRENVKNFLRENPDITKEIENKI